MDKASPEEVQAHLGKALRRLKVAQGLHRQGEYEDAVSRAYYAIYHAAHAALAAEGFRPQTHRGLTNLFGLHLVETGKLPKKLAKYMRNVRDDREEGDYEIYSVIDQETSQTALREVEEFIRAIQEFLKPRL